MDTVSIVCVRGAKPSTGMMCSTKTRPVKEQFENT